MNMEVANSLHRSLIISSSRISEMNLRSKGILKDSDLYCQIKLPHKKYKFTALVCLFVCIQVYPLILRWKTKYANTTLARDVHATQYSGNKPALGSGQPGSKPHPAISVSHHLLELYSLYLQNRFDILYFMVL